VQALTSLHRTLACVGGERILHYDEVLTSDTNEAYLEGNYT
jgi:hypothetical protein